MLATVRPRDIAGKTRRRIAADELAELIAVEAKIKKSTAELKTIVLDRGSRLKDVAYVGQDSYGHDGSASAHQGAALGSQPSRLAASRPRPGSFRTFMRILVCCVFG